MALVHTARSVIRRLDTVTGMGMVVRRRRRRVRPIGRSQAISYTAGRSRSMLSTVSSMSSRGHGRTCRIGVAMSGGVDSSVCAYMLARLAKYDDAKLLSLLQTHRDTLHNDWLPRKAFEQMNQTAIPSSSSTEDLPTRFEVVGLHMVNWDSQDEKGLTGQESQCTATDDLNYAKRVADQLGISLKVLDFVKPYWNHVFAPSMEVQCGLQHIDTVPYAFFAQFACLLVCLSFMSYYLFSSRLVSFLFLPSFLPSFQQYEMGITPNPDILCNSEIKFKRFLSSATTLASTQCDYVATGHYVRRGLVPIDLVQQQDPALHGKDYRPALLNGVDLSKDQSYFLSGIEQDALERVLFPIGAMQKDAVREMARGAGLVSAARKDSYGICFIGERSNRPSVDDPTYYSVSRASLENEKSNARDRNRTKMPRNRMKGKDDEEAIARQAMKELAAKRALPSLDSRRQSFANFMSNYVDLYAQKGCFVDINTGKQSSKYFMCRKRVFCACCCIAHSLFLSPVIYKIKFEN